MAFAIRLRALPRGRSRCHWHFLARLRARPLGRFCRSVQGGRAGSSRPKVARRASPLAGAVSILTDCLDGCRAILSRSRCCRLGGADPRSCRSGQTARVGRAAEGAPKGQAPLAGRSLGPHGTAVPGQRLCRCLSPPAASVPLCRSVQGEACEALDGCRAILSRSRRCRLGGADPRSCRSGQTARVGRAAEGALKGKPRLRGAVSARTGRLCRVNGSAGASLSCCGLCAALPISPGRSLRSPRRVPGNPVPVPALSARRGRSSVLPVRPDGTGGSSRRRRPEGASPACGAQSRPARDGCAGSTALPVPLSLLRPLCRSADQSRAKPAKP